jgi:hypothetical protein
MDSLFSRRFDTSGRKDSETTVPVKRFVSWRTRMLSLASPRHHDVHGIVPLISQTAAKGANVEFIPSGMFL